MSPRTTSTYCAPAHLQGEDLTRYWTRRMDHFLDRAAAAERDMHLLPVHAALEAQSDSIYYLSRALWADMVLRDLRSGRSGAERDALHDATPATPPAFTRPLTLDELDLPY